MGKKAVLLASINVKAPIIPGLGMIGAFGLSGTSGLFDHVSAPLPSKNGDYSWVWNGHRSWVKRNKLAVDARFGTAAKHAWHGPNQ